MEVDWSGNFPAKLFLVPSPTGLLTIFYCHISRSRTPPESGVHWDREQLFIDYKTAFDSVRREILDSIRTEFRIQTKLLRLIICGFWYTFSIYVQLWLSFLSSLLQIFICTTCFGPTANFHV
jgi:hypothetical protein